MVLLVAFISKDNPEKAFERYMDANINCDIDGFVNSFYFDADILEEYEMTKKEFKKMLHKKINKLGCQYDSSEYKYKILSSKIDGKTAIIKIRETYKGYSGTDEIKMHKFGNKWYVDFQQFDYFLDI